MIFKKLLVAIYFHTDKKESVSVEEVTRAIRNSLMSLGRKLEEPPVNKRADNYGFTDVLGVINYGGFNYDVLFNRDPMASEKRRIKTLADKLKTDQISGGIKFTQRWETAPGLAPVAAELHFEPNPSRVEFLKKVALGFRNEQPDVNWVVVGYQPDRNTGFVYKEI